jgi:hypothetical protein
VEVQNNQSVKGTLVPLEWECRTNQPLLVLIRRLVFGKQRLQYFHKHLKEFDLELAYGASLFEQLILDFWDQ